MSFLKPQTKIEITIRIEREKVPQLQKDIEVILNKLNPDQMNLLARAVSDPIIRMAAIAELKSRLKTAGIQVITLRQKQYFK